MIAFFFPLLYNLAFPDQQREESIHKQNGVVFQAVKIGLDHLRLFVNIILQYLRLDHDETMVQSLP